MAEQKIMTRIMRLMERANHPETPEAERVACMDRAEEMMARHMIDRMDLKPESTSKVVADTWDIMWGDIDGEFRYHVQDLVLMVVKHCGIRVHPDIGYARDENGRTEMPLRKRFKLVGFPEDMMYADQIWFRVFKEFVSNISPKWDASKPLAENVYQFARAGLSWGQIHSAASNAREDRYGLPELLNGGGAKLRNLYREECQRRGEEYNKTRTHEAYRATFVQSYSATIGRRLRDMRDSAKEHIADNDKFAVALRSTQERVDEEFYRLYPEYDPAVIRRMKDAEAAEILAQWHALSDDDKRAVAAYAEAEREQISKANDEWERKWRAREARGQRARRNYGAVRERVTFDQTAWDRGNSVASKVNLNVDAEVKDHKKGELNG